MSGGQLIPFRRPVRAAGTPVPRPRPVNGGAIVVQVTGPDVVVLADDVELELTPDQARELAQELLDLADDAESCRG